MAKDMYNVTIAFVSNIPNSYESYVRRLSNVISMGDENRHLLVYKMTQILSMLMLWYMIQNTSSSNFGIALSQGWGKDITVGATVSQISSYYFYYSKTYNF